MALADVIQKTDLAKASKSFGIVGSAALSKSMPVFIVASNNNDPVSTQETINNKPIVKMVRVLASIDGFLKQKLQNQKIITNNEILADRESSIEQQSQQPEIYVEEQDAEKTGGSRLGGMLALGGLALLAFEPVRDVIKQVIDGVVSIGTFVTDAVKSINGVFDFFFSEDAQSKTLTKSAPTTTERPTEQAPSAAPAQPTPTPSPPATPEPTESPGILSRAASAVGAGARFIFGGGLVGMYLRSDSSESESAQAATRPATVSQSEPTRTSAPRTTTSRSPTRSAGATPVQATNTEIPRNDIVALGNYLVARGAERHKLEHPAFGPVGRHSPRSRHYRGMAIDVNFPGPNEAALLDELEPQLRAAGYNTIWRAPEHTTHMHVSVGGPEGGGGTSYGDSDRSMMEVIADTAMGGLEQAASLFGILGSAIVSPGVARTDIPNTIAIAARELNTDIAESRTETLPTPPVPPTPPRLNRGSATSTQNPPTMEDRNSVYYYLRRFGYQDLSRPEAVLAR